MKIETVRTNVIDFLTDHRDSLNLAIGGLKYSTETEANGSNSEQMIGSRLLEVESDEGLRSSLLECRFEQVIRMIEIWMRMDCEKRVPDVNFILLKEFLEKFGACGSVLLERLDIGRLSPSQMKDLKSMKYVKWNFVNDSIFRVLFEFMDLSDSQSRTIREQRCFLEQSTVEICELRSLC
jgi:hypothetical protein